MYLLSGTWVAALAGTAADAAILGYASYDRA
jgi:hypothetical protein